MTFTREIISNANFAVDIKVKNPQSDQSSTSNNSNLDMYYNEKASYDCNELRRGYITPPISPVPITNSPPFHRQRSCPYPILEIEIDPLSLPLLPSERMVSFYLLRPSCQIENAHTSSYYLTSSSDFGRSRLQNEFTELQRYLWFSTEASG